MSTAVAALAVALLLLESAAPLRAEEAEAAGEELPNFKKMRVKVHSSPVPVSVCVKAELLKVELSMLTHALDMPGLA